MRDVERFLNQLFGCLHVFLGEMSVWLVCPHLLTGLINFLHQLRYSSNFYGVMYNVTLINEF